MVILQVWTDSGEAREFTFLSKRDAGQAQELLIWVTREVISEDEPVFFSKIME